MPSQTTNTSNRSAATLTPATWLNALPPTSIRESIITQIRERVCAPSCPKSEILLNLKAIGDNETACRIFDTSIPHVRAALLTALSLSDLDIKRNAVAALSKLASIDNQVQKRFMAHIETYYERTCRMKPGSASNNSWFYDRSVPLALEALRPLLPHEVEIRALVLKMARHGRWTHLVHRAIEMLGDIAPTNGHARRFLGSVATNPNWDMDGFPHTALQSLRGCLGDQSIVDKLEQIIPTAYLPRLLVVLDSTEQIPTKIQLAFIERIQPEFCKDFSLEDKTGRFAADYLARAARVTLKCLDVPEWDICAAFSNILLAGKGGVKSDTDAAKPDLRGEIIADLVTANDFSLPMLKAILRTVAMGSRLSGARTMSEFEVWDDASVKTAFLIGQTARKSEDQASHLISFVRNGLCTDSTGYYYNDGFWFAVAALGPLFTTRVDEVSPLIEKAIELRTRGEERGLVTGAIRALDYVLEESPNNSRVLKILAKIATPTS